MRETLLFDMPHRQVVLTIPKTLHIFYKYRRRIQGELSGASVKALMVCFEALAGEPFVPGIIIAVQTFGDRINFHPHLRRRVTEGDMNRAGVFQRMDSLELIARVMSHIPDKGQVMVRYCGLYANAHRGKARKAGRRGFPVRIVEEELSPVPSKGWAEMIRKVYEVDPMIAPAAAGG